MTAGFQVHGSGVRSVAASLADNSELAAQAGVRLAQLGDELPAPGVGERLVSVLSQFSGEWCDVLDDMGTSLAELAGWLDRAVTSYFSVDSDTAYRVGNVHP